MVFLPTKSDYRFYVNRPNPTTKLSEIEGVEKQQMILVTRSFDLEVSLEMAIHAIPVQNTHAFSCLESIAQFMRSMSSPCSYLPTCGRYNYCCSSAGFGVHIRLVKEPGMRYAHIATTQSKPKIERAPQVIRVDKKFCQQSALLPSAEFCNLMQMRDSQATPALMAVSQQATTSMLAGDAVMIVDHGSRRPESNVMLHEFVELYKQKTGHPIVEPAHMELAEPSIGTAFKRCVEQGAARVIISPYFLFPGRHWDKDIPALAAQAAEQHTGVPYVVTAPIGLHELMVRVVEDRMQHCVSHVAGKVSECSMCAGTGRCRLLTSNPTPTISTNSSDK